MGRKAEKFEMNDISGDAPNHVLVSQAFRSFCCGGSLSRLDGWTCSDPVLLA
eukprot:COSAG02_NODE_63829_length_262_cov_0.638037_1_plen_51_part_10